MPIVGVMTMTGVPLLAPLGVCRPRVGQRNGFARVVMSYDSDDRIDRQ
jgi:hypothetical protein